MHKPGLSSRLGRALARARQRPLLAAALGVGLVLLMSAVLSQREPLRRLAAESIDPELKHSIISTYSLLLSRPRETADLVPVANADVKPYAINVFFEQEVEEIKIRRSMELIRDAGFAWIKQQVVWAEIEVPGKGSYGDSGETWDKYDRIVSLAQEYGLGVILRIDTSPAWARWENDKLETPPDRYEDYGDFVYAVASRYRGKVRHYQIWNEPNLAFEWGGNPPRPAEYVDLLKVAYTRAKEADPDSVVLSAALAPTIEESEIGQNDLKYLQSMYDHGARGYFDVLSTNAYGLRHGPDDWRLEMDRDVNFSRAILLREAMVRNGDAGKPIWAAEVGWNALPPDFGETPRYGVVTREQQARYSARAYQRSQQEWPWMGVMALWHFRMIHVRDVIQQQYYFNVVSEDFEPYPVYQAVKDLAASQPVLGRGYHQESHWTLSFSPEWQAERDPRASLEGYVWTDDPAGQLAFEFEGTALDLVVPRGPDRGRLEVTIDGAPFAASELPTADRRTYLDLYSPTEEWQVRVPVARGLTDSRHQVAIAPASTRHPHSVGSWVAIDGVVVDGPWPQDRLYQRLAGLALLLVGLFTALRSTGLARRASRARPAGERGEAPREASPNGDGDLARAAASVQSAAAEGVRAR